MVLTINSFGMMRVADGPLVYRLVSDS